MSHRELSRENIGRVASIVLCISARIISLECENALGSYQTVVSNLTGNFVMLFVQMKKLKNILKKFL